MGSKKFENAGAAKKLEEVAQASEEKARVLASKNIRVEDLVEYPLNDEDVSQTEDLEESIKKYTFNVPLGVVPNADGKYMIVSGHRRFAAGQKCGLVVFPCNILDLSTPEEIEDYSLRSNQYRHEIDNPMMLAKRCTRYEALLERTGFKGKKEKRLQKLWL